MGRWRCRRLVTSVGGIHAKKQRKTMCTLEAVPQFFLNILSGTGRKRREMVEMNEQGEKPGYGRTKADEGAYDGRGRKGRFPYGQRTF